MMPAPAAYRSSIASRRDSAVINPRSLPPRPCRTATAKRKAKSPSSIVLARMVSELENIRANSIYIGMHPSEARIILYKVAEAQHVWARFLRITPAEGSSGRINHHRR
jgi:hypothetical protein